MHAGVHAGSVTKRTAPIEPEAWKKVKVVTQRKTTNTSTRNTRVTTDRRTRKTRTTTESSLVSAYVGVPLKPAKVKDLLKIANKFLLPSTRSFYMSLKTAAPDAGNTDDHGSKHEDSD